jgi:hypothetical protein
MKENKIFEKRLLSFLKKNKINEDVVNEISDFIIISTQSFEVWKWQNNFDMIGTLKYRNKKTKNIYSYWELMYFFKKHVEEKDSKINFK